MLFNYWYPNENRGREAIRLLEERGLDFEGIVKARLVRDTALGRAFWWGRISPSMVVNIPEAGFVRPSFAREPTKGRHDRVIVRDTEHDVTIARVNATCASYHLLLLETIKPCDYLWLEPEERGSLMFVRMEMNYFSEPLRARIEAMMGGQ